MQYVAYCKWCNKCMLIHSRSIKALLWIMHLGKSKLSIVESPCLAPNGWIEVAHYRLCSVSLISASQSSFSSLGLAKCIRRLCLCGGAWNTQRFIYKPTAYVCPAVLLNAFIRAWFTGMRGLFCFASLERMFTFILFIKASLTRGQNVQNNKDDVFKSGTVECRPRYCVGQFNGKPSAWLMEVRRECARAVDGNNDWDTTPPHPLILIRCDTVLSRRPILLQKQIGIQGPSSRH